MTYRVRYMYHPSLWVRDRAEADAFFARVFGRRSVRQEDFHHKWAVPGYPNDYCTWTMVADVWIDCIEPRNYVIDGRQIFPDIDRPGHLQGWGWYVDGMVPLYQALREAGVPMEDQLGEAATGERPPSTVASSSYYPLFMSHFDGGMRYEFIEYPGDVPGVAAAPLNGVDERLDPDWTLRPLPGDPLGIRRTSHHTIVTREPDRATRFMVDLLGGKVVRQAPNALLGADSVWIALGGDLFEYAVPASDDGIAAADWRRNGGNDTYHAISFEVEDLAQVRNHLATVGVSIAAEDDATIVAEAETALGVPWGFTTARPAA